MLNIAVLRPCKVQEPKPPKSKLGGGYDVLFKKCRRFTSKDRWFCTDSSLFLSVINIFRNLKYLVFANFVQQLHDFK